MEWKKDRLFAFVQEFVEEFGGRPAGSEREKEAQEHFASRCREFTDQVTVDRFRNPLGGKFKGLLPIGITFFVSLFMAYPTPYFAFFPSLLAAIFFIFHFLNYRNWLDILFKNKTSHNVSATLEPQKEVKSTIWVSGHMDSVYEFQWWYRLGSFGAFLTILGGITIITLPIYCLFAGIWGLQYIFGIYMGENGLGNVEIYMIPKYIWAFWLLLSPSVFSLMFMHGSTVVDGAGDNLTGVASAFALAESLRDPENKGKSVLQHTRIGVISFGAEETGLKGSKAFIEANRQMLKSGKHLLLNIDTIKEVENLTIVRKEINPGVKYPPALIEDMETAFEKIGVSPQKLPLKIGATDGAMWRRNKIPALSIIGMNSKKLDPTYHTRRDTLENLDPEAMEKLHLALREFVQDWDEKQSAVV